MIFLLSARYAPTPLPYDLYAPASVPFRNTLLLVGGYSFREGTHPHTILEFDAETETWVTREETLEVGREFGGAALVKDDVVDCV